MQEQMTVQKRQAIYKALLAKIDPDENNRGLSELCWINPRGEDRFLSLRELEDYLKQHVEDLGPWQNFLRGIPLLEEEKDGKSGELDLFYPIGNLKVNRFIPTLYAHIQDYQKYNALQLLALAALVTGSVTNALPMSENFAKQDIEVDIAKRRRDKVTKEEVQRELNTLLQSGIHLFEGETTQFSEALENILQEKVLENPVQKKPRLTLAATLFFLALTFLLSVF